jgi:tRNA pseudouridine55 synthase
VTPGRYSAPAPPADLGRFDGVLLVDKPAGPTSHDVVDAVRGLLGIRKVGHGGTLDPAATGLLVMLIGRGTKLSNRFLSSDKVYEGDLWLGAATDSHDADGKVVSEAPFEHVTEEKLQEAMAGFRGDVYQTPPMVSAVKVDGAPLYKHARKGRTVERKAKLIHIYEFRLLDFEPPRAGFLMRCSKGTYVRTVCHEIGEQLGCGAHLRHLRRLASGELDVSRAVALEDLLRLGPDEARERILPLRLFMRL